LAKTCLLFRLKNRRVDALLTAVTAVLLAVSRFALLANGPWEWDEVAFARGVLDFDLAAYFPHPPGYPGWLAVGHALTPIFGEPMVALQVASAAFSVVALWLLAALGRRVAHPSVAAAAGVLVLVAPGPWLYAVRGFTTTAACVLALAAAVVAVGGLGGHRTTAFTLLLTASCLVRPHFLPVLVVIWFAVAGRVRPLRRLLPGIVLGTAAAVVALMLMVRAQGGLEAFMAPFLSHSQRHFSRLVGNAGGYSELGLVKGFGGFVPATLIISASVLGAVMWARKVGKRVGLLWVVVMSLAVAQLVWMQNRTYCRYAVGVQLAAAPLVAGAASVVPPALGSFGLLAAAGWLGAESLSLVVEQHETQLAGWRAVQRAQEIAVGTGQTVVVESELHLFASYLWSLRESRRQPTPRRTLSPWDPGPWNGVRGSYLVATVHRGFYGDSVFGVEEWFGGASADLRPLTQQRFLEAWVIEDPPLPLAGWWPGEREPGGRRFMWGGAGAELLLPPIPKDARLMVWLRPAPGSEPLVLKRNGREVARLDGLSGEKWVQVKSDPSEVGKTSLLRFERAAAYPPGGGDERALAVQLFHIRARTQGAAWSGSVTHPNQRQLLQVEIAGAFEPEVFPDIGEGMWLKPSATLRVPAAPGRLRLRLWAPRPSPSRTVIRVAGRRAAGPLDLGPRPGEIEVDVLPGEAPDGRLEIEISSEPYRPADDGGEDQRSLGVVLSEIAFEPLGGGS
jgi:hypothetical protein